MGPKKLRKIFSQRSQERSEELSAERCQESAASKRESMDEEGQKYKVAYCPDRYTENRDKPLHSILAFTGSQWGVLSSSVALACLDLRRTGRAA